MEQAVIVTLKLSGSWFGKRKERAAGMALSAQLEKLLADSADKEFDGDEYGGGECTLYMYGEDADALFAAIEPTLRAAPVAKGAQVVKRYGDALDPDAREESLTL